MTLPLNTIICGDCLDVMKTFEDKSVDLIVTSPPYNCKKPYIGYSDDLTWEHYWSFSGGWLNESYNP